MRAILLFGLLANSVAFAQAKTQEDERIVDEGGDPQVVFVTAEINEVAATETLCNQTVCDDDPQQPRAQAGQQRQYLSDAQALIQERQRLKERRNNWFLRATALGARYEVVEAWSEATRYNDRLLPAYRLTLRQHRGKRTITVHTTLDSGVLLDVGNQITLASPLSDGDVVPLSAVIVVPQSFLRKEAGQR